MTKAKALLAQMTQGEKVGQLIMIGLNGLDNAKHLGWENSAASINQTQIDNIKKYSPGGVILFKANAQSTAQITAYTAALQKHSRVPMFISVDEEGGNVSRLGGNKDIDVARLPTPAEQGRLSLEEFASLRANLCRQLKKLGINDNHDTMCDLPTNPHNYIIKGLGRYYNEDIAKTCDFIKTNIRVAREEKIITSAKHFPGHGDTTVDSHEEMPVCDMTLDQLAKRELLPFRAAVEANAPRIMVSHIAYPKITGDEKLPASMSAKMISILRTDLGFGGIIITDDMLMDAIRKYYTPGQSAAAAIAAGNDMLIYRINLAEVFEGILAAVGKTIPQSRLDESVLRILETKIQYGII